MDKLKKEDFKKVTRLVLSGHDPITVKESVEEIVTAKNKAIAEGGEQADLFYTSIDAFGDERKGSCIVPLYRGVYETIQKVK